MKLEDVFDSYSDNILPTYTKTPLVFVKGKGSRLWDIHGREYLDFFPGWGVNNLGHCHPKVMQAVRDQVSKLVFVPNNYYHLPQAKLAKELIYRSFPGKVFFCNSGAEANEAAIKLARKYGAGLPAGQRDARYEIITFENSFHGRTLGALSATGQKKYQEGFGPLVPGFVSVPFNSLDAVRAAMTERTVAVMLELVQGEGGVNVAEQQFVRDLRQLCTERNCLLIVDEVQTGIGRTGDYFCFLRYGIEPDVVTLAKALGGGLPIGAMIVAAKIADVLQPGMHASTFGGGPVVCRAALAVLTSLQKEKLLPRCREMSEFLFEGLKTLREKHACIRDVRGMGLMAGIELSTEGAGVVKGCMERGLLINCTHATVIRLMPALIVTRGQIAKALSIIDDVLSRTGA
jgi:acetylornithine/N-succinyldiaminopimelate aminotransferase